MSDFLLELFSEEIPARMQAGARSDLERLFRAQLDAAGLKADAITTYSTPRRLALIATGLPAQTEAVSEEAKGPPEGAPDAAIDGFCRKQGISRDQLEIRDVKGRNTYFAVIDKPGQPTTAILGPAIANIVRDFPWPKSMRWGAASASSESMRWVRPLHRIVAMLGEEIVPVEIEGVICGAASLGHRFHHPGEITFGGAHDYVDKLRMAHVLVDHEERQDIVRQGAADAAAKAGHELIEDEGLVIENAGLTEWPVPLLGSFDPDFLDVPEEVIQLTARLDQKYFVMRGKDGRLAPNFVLTSNIDSSDPAAVIAGNERVLTARLSDARFFWENDKKSSLEAFAEKLDRSVFFEGLGTYAEKAARIAELAAHLSANYVPGIDPQQTGRAAELAKADLTSGTVGEFPELQGIIGGYLAGDLSEAQAEAITYQYRDDPPSAMSQVVGLADRIDSLVAFFARGQKPTGSKDPFALRRAALQTIKIITSNGLRLPLLSVFEKAERGLVYDEQGLVGELDRADLLEFFADRLKVQQKEAGVRHDLIDAVFALGGEDDLVRLLARVKALQAFMETEDGANLHSAYKRAANILKKEKGSWSADQASDGDIDAAEAALGSALDVAEPKAASALEAEDFTAAMAALASLRAPIDAFFDDVIVNAEDAGVRARRLALLARFRGAVSQVADFSKIEG